MYVRVEKRQNPPYTKVKTCVECRIYSHSSCVRCSAVPVENPLHCQHTFLITQMGDINNLLCDDKNIKKYTKKRKNRSKTSIFHIYLQTFFAIQ